MHSVVVSVQNWNFVIPLILWFAKEVYVRLKVRSRRVRTWGIRRDRSVRVIVDQQRTGGNYLTGDLGPLAEARTVQKLMDHFRSLGLHPEALDAMRFEQGRIGNAVIGGVLSQGDCLARTMLMHLGYAISDDGGKYTIGGSELAFDLRLTESRLSVRAEHAIVLQSPNPDDTRHVMTVIAALTANGLEGTVDALIHRHPALVFPRNQRATGFIITISVDTRDVEMRPLAAPHVPRISRLL